MDRRGAGRQVKGAGAVVPVRVRHPQTAVPPSSLPCASAAGNPLKGLMMTSKFLLPLTLAAFTPLAALAMPAVGDMIGTDPETAKAALEKAGCPVTEFEAEDGKIEAKCKDAATGAEMEVYIDPATGKVVEIKAED